MSASMDRSRSHENEEAPSAAPKGHTKPNDTTTSRRGAKGHVGKQTQHHKGIVMTSEAALNEGVPGGRTRSRSPLGQRHRTNLEANRAVHIGQDPYLLPSSSGSESDAGADIPPHVVVENKGPTSNSSSLALMSPQSHTKSSSRTKTFVSPLAQRRAKLKAKDEDATNALSDYEFRVLIDEIDLGDGEEEGSGQSRKVVQPLSIALNEPLQNAGHSTDVISPKPPDVENKSAAPSKLGKSIILPANDTNDDSKNSPRGSILSLQSNRDQKQHSTTDKRSTSTLADAHTIVEYRDTNRQLATALTKLQVHSKELAKRNLSLEQLLTKRISDMRELRKSLLEEASQREQELASERDKLRRENEKAQEQIQGLEAKIHTLEERFTLTTAEYESREAALQETNAKLEAELRTARDRLTQVETNSSNLESSLSRLTDEHSRLMVELAHTREAAKNVADANQWLERALIAAKEQISTLRRTLAELLEVQSEVQKGSVGQGLRDACRKNQTRSSTDTSEPNADTQESRRRLVEQPSQELTESIGHDTDSSAPDGVHSNNTDNTFQESKDPEP